MIYLSANGDLSGVSAETKYLLADPETERILSVVSLIEVAIRNTTGKGVIPISYIQQAALDLRLTVIPFTALHADELFYLPLHHRDPFDRMLIATALKENIPIVGSDRIFKKYRGLSVLW